ncbi:MAG: VWA domain-containing protein [Planctomycetes bacterium]|nr:VWA domain-containing protein [Planctomycetota bacterium]
MLNSRLSSSLRSTTASGLVIIAGLLGTVSSTLAQTVTSTNPTSGREAWISSAANIVIPQGRTIRTRTGIEAVAIQSVHADVSIEDQVATTTLEITLSNASGSALETEMVLPVPEGAIVKGFVLDGIKTNEGQARILPKDEARRIYESIVRQTRDPGLVEFLGTAAIRTSVFPVPASGTQKLRISYEQIVKVDGNRVDYTLPRTESVTATGTEWTASINIKSAKPIGTVYSPSHQWTVERKGAGEMKIAISKEQGNAPGSLRLSYLLGGTSDGMSTTVFTYPDPDVAGGKGGYFLMVASPGTVADRPKVKREVTVVIDRSGSMQGQKIEQAKKAALQTISALDSGESFNIIDYSDSVKAFNPTAVVKNADTLKNASDYISNIKAIGGTNLHDALVESLSAKPVDTSAMPLVLFLTDGRATIGQTAELAIRDNAAKANQHNRRVFSFGVGFDVNAPLLTTVAEAARGTSTFVMPDEDVEVKVGKVFRQLSGPTLASPTFTDASAKGGKSSLIADVMPATLPDLFEGDQLVIVGQYLTTSSGTITLAGQSFGKDASHSITINPDTATTRNAFVPRLWAGRKIAFLTDQIRRMGADGTADAHKAEVKELTEEIVRLSTRWGILTEYTAFLADETTNLADATTVRELAAKPMAEAAADRGGITGVAKEINQNVQKYQAELSTQNCWTDGQMRQVRITSVQNCGDQAMLRRNNRWVDTKVYQAVQANKLDATKVDQTIKVGSSEYFTLCNTLEQQGRQTLLAQEGEIELLLDGKRVLITPQ